MKIKLFVVLITASVCIPGLSQQYSGKALVDSTVLKPNTILLTAPGQGVFAVQDGRTMISLENQDIIPSVIFPEILIVEDAAANGFGLFVKSRESIYLCNSEGIVHFLRFDTDSFRITPTNDGNLFIFFNLERGNSLYYLDCGTRQHVLLSEFPEPIIAATGTIEDSFVITERRIYLLSNKQINLLLNCPDIINSAIYTGDGLLFSTPSDILLLRGIDSVEVLGRQGCKQLLTDRSYLYVWYNDGSLVRFEKQ